MSVRISYGFCAMICLLGWLDEKLCFWFLTAGAIHEMGHVLYLTVRKIPITGFALRASGAVLQIPQLPYGQEAAAAAAGPAASLLLGLILLRYASLGAVISFLLGGVNLLPLFPLDGGRILQAILFSVLPSERAERWMLVINHVVCCALMLAACWVTVRLQAGIWPIFAALVLLWRVGTKEKQLLFRW